MTNILFLSNLSVLYKMSLKADQKFMKTLKVYLTQPLGLSISRIRIHCLSGHIKITIYKIPSHLFSPNNRNIPLRFSSRKIQIYLVKYKSSRKNHSNFALNAFFISLLGSCCIFRGRRMDGGFLWGNIVGYF